MSRFFVSLVLYACVAACASPYGGSGSGGGQQYSIEAGTPGRVTYVDYRSSLRFSLVNEAHTDPLTLYSEKRNSASTKVTSNEVFAAMLEEFENQGFSKYAAGGFAPISGSASLRKAIEFETEGQVRFILLDINAMTQTDESVEASNAVLNCGTAFLQVFNMTEQNQAVTNEGGKALFEEQQRQLYENSKKNNQR